MGFIFMWIHRHKTRIYQQDSFDNPVQVWLVKIDGDYYHLPESL